MSNNIEDGEKRVCHACGNTEFHRNYYNLAVCSNIVCYKTYEPLRALDKLFRAKSLLEKIKNNEGKAAASSKSCEA